MKDMERYLRFDGPPRESNGTMIIALAGSLDPTCTTTHALRHITDSLGTTQFASLEPDEFYLYNEAGPMSAGRVEKKAEDNEIRITWPGAGFQQTPEGNPPGPIMMIGHHPSLRLQAMGLVIAHIAELCAVTTVLQLSAPIMPHPHTAPPDLRGFSTNSDHAELLEIAGTAQPGAGIDDPAVLEACLQNLMGYTILSGRVPVYLNICPNPITALHLAEHINGKLGLQANLDNLRKEDQDLRETVAQSMQDSPFFEMTVREFEAHRQKRLDGLEEIDPGSVAREVDDFLRGQG